MDEFIEDALRELADGETQERLWSSSGDADVSSLAEVSCRLWDDSGLTDAMDRGIVYTEEIDNKLRRLDEVLGRIDVNAPVSEILASPHLVVARSMAAELLVDLRNFGYER